MCVCVCRCSSIGHPGRTHTQTMEKSPRCKVHRQPLETFCQDCSEVVCQTCAKTGHKTHHSQLSVGAGESTEGESGRSQELDTALL